MGQMVKTFQIPISINPIKERLRKEILSHLKGVSEGYRANYVMYLLNGKSHSEVTYTHKQIDEMLDHMVEINDLKIVDGKFVAT